MRARLRDIARVAINRRPTEPGDKARGCFAIRALVSGGAALASLALLTAHAGATPPVVYHSPADDGSNPGSPFEISPVGQTTLHLYIDGGPTPSPSEPCHAGTGDEVCGWDLLMQGSIGTLDLVSFVGTGDVVFNLNGSSLRFNGGDFGNGTLGPSKIGDLVVEGTTGGTLDLMLSKSVTSGLAVATIAQTTVITVPEPGLPLSLISGASLLGILSRLRPRRTQTAGQRAKTRVD